MTPPDSDAVCGVMVARVNGHPLECEMARGHDGAHEAKLAGPLSAIGAIAIPHHLAQRILAALSAQTVREECAGFSETSDRLGALAAELRALLVTR